MARLAELLPHLGHHLFGQVQQHELHVRGIEVHLLCRGVRQRPQLRHEFGARVRGADDDDRAAGLYAVVVIVDVGQFQLFEYVVAEIDRLCGRLETRAYSANPGISNNRVTEPGVNTSQSHDRLRDRCSGSVNVTVCWSKSTPSTRPRTVRTPRNVFANGMVTNRASTRPPATSGNSGVYSM